VNAKRAGLGKNLPVRRNARGQTAAGGGVLPERPIRRESEESTDQTDAPPVKRARRVEIAPVSRITAGDGIVTGRSIRGESGGSG
jgi:hypothetical protein